MSYLVLSYKFPLSFLTTYAKKVPDGEIYKNDRLVMEIGGWVLNLVYQVCNVSCNTFPGVTLNADNMAMILKKRMKWIRNAAYIGCIPTVSLVSARVSLTSVTMKKGNNHCVPSHTSTLLNG
jgi:hypothetical protein